MWLLDALEQRKEDDATAIIYRNEKISYKELWHRSECIAKYLIDNGYDKHPLVLYGNKEIDIVSCMHAALKVGVPYVPVDTLYPVERLKKIAGIVEADLIVNFSDKSGFACSEINHIKLSKIYAELEETPSSNKDLWVKEEDTCYILFTSGSTGEPKGVPISKGNLINFCDWFKKYIEYSDEGNGTINQAPYSFDLSVIGLFVCLPMGKYLLNVDKNMSGNLKELCDYIKINQPAIWISTPSFLDVCTYDRIFFSAAHSLNLIVCDGEIFSKNLAEKLFKGLNGLRIVNAYGPTEATVAITGCEIFPEMIDSEFELPIGMLLDDGVAEITQEYKGDDGSTDVGELSIISKSVAAGYYKNQLQTEKCFFVRDGVTGYRTGDLVFVNNGLMYYVGRKDFQIKLHGYRIELSDIESNLNKLDMVESSVVLPVTKDDKIDYLVAFIITNGSTEESPLKFSIKIKNELRKLVPVYMVPKKIIKKDTFPLNTNGKVDRKKLLEEINP